MPVPVQGMVLTKVQSTAMPEAGYYIHCNNTNHIGYRHGSQETKVCFLGMGMWVTATIVQDITEKLVATSKFAVVTVHVETYDIDRRPRRNVHRVFPYLNVVEDG